jgi:hypothetical protein
MTMPYTYCPTCGDVLNTLPILDIHASAFSCRGDHRFLQYNKQVLGTETDQAAALASAHDMTDNDMSIIEYWLGNESVRSCLNDQLAEILQNIYWSCGSEEHIRPEGDTFIHCPLCGSELNDFEQDDVWVQGKRCGNGHDFYERGGRLNYSVEGESRHLVGEMSDEVLDSLIEGWLKDNRRLTRQLPRQVRGVLERYRH